MPQPFAVRRRGFYSLAMGLALSAVLTGSPTAAYAAPAEKSVRVIYLVPKDRERRKDYEDAMATCVRELQVWFYGEMGGKTFRLNDPIVEVVTTPHEAAWYDKTQPENCDDQSLYTFYNTLTDAAALLKVQGGDPNYTWLIYIDAPGGTGAGMPGVAILPEHDLLGLIGKHEKEPNIPRWHGGAGHELGHAFGLPHPGDEFAQAIMQYGYTAYPACYFNLHETRTLNDSPFLHKEQPLLFKGVNRPIHFYDGGYFVRTGEGQWEERKQHSNELYRFKENGADDESIHLHDASRQPGAWVSLPKAGKGTAVRFKWEGRDWQRIYDVKE